MIDNGYTTLTAPERTGPFVPFAWCIEFGMDSTAFIRHDQRHDRAYAEQRAVDLHGVLVPLFTDRRKVAR